jgi:Zn-dependent M28 family amino/carboxypeptidase
LGSAEPDADDPIFNGAYDNASGVAVLLEIARALSGMEPTPRRSVLFLAATGEEQGALGADWFVHHPTVNRDGIVAAFDLDTLLMLHARQGVSAPGAGRSTLGRQVELAAGQLGLALDPGPPPESFPLPCAEHDAFLRGGFPALAMTGGSASDANTEDAEAIRGWMRDVYHTPGDDLNQPFDFEAGAGFVRLGYLLVRSVADSDERPLWIPGNPFAERYGRAGPRPYFVDRPPE